MIIDDNWTKVGDYITVCKPVLSLFKNSKRFSPRLPWIIKKKTRWPSPTKHSSGIWGIPAASDGCFNIDNPLPHETLLRNGKRWEMFTYLGPSGGSLMLMGWVWSWWIWDDFVGSPGTPPTQRANFFPSEKSRRSPFYLFSLSLFLAIKGGSLLSHRPRCQRQCSNFLCHSKLCNILVGYEWDSQFMDSDHRQYVCMYVCMYVCR